MSRVRVDDISSTITFAQYQLNRSCNGYKPIALAILQAKITFVGNYILPLLNARDTQDLTKGRNFRSITLKLACVFTHDVTKGNVINITKTKEGAI